MEVLQLQDLNKFNLLGLKAICSHNRDVLYSYNFLTRKQIIERIKNEVNNNHVIKIPCFIYNSDYILIKKKIG